MSTTVRVQPVRNVLRGHHAFADSNYSSNQEDFYFNNPPSTPPIHAEYDHPLKIESITSIESPSWAVPEPRYILVPKRRKPFILRKPVMPRLPLEPLPPPPLVRREGSSKSSYQRALRRYGAELAAYRLRVVAYRALLLKIHRNYEAKLVAYNSKLSAYRYRPLGSRKQRIGKIIHSVNNPYRNTVVRDRGWEINYTYQQKMVRLKSGSSYYMAYGPGPYVWHERAFYGWSDVMPSSIVLGTYTPILPPAYNASDLISSATDKAVASLFEKIGDETAHIGNMIAERAQTYDMLNGAINRLADFVRGPKAALKELVGSGVRDSSKKVANGYLQYCFGVEPLARDIYALSSHLNQMNAEENKRDMVKVRAGGSASYEHSWKTGTFYFTDTHRVKVTARVRYMCEYRIDNAVFVSLRKFGLVNPAEILWEVTPWSFVIDWVLPVGEFIKSIGADRGLHFRIGTRSTVVTTQTSVERKYHFAQSRYDQGILESGELKRHVSIVSKEREVLSSAPVSRLPSFKNPFSNRHVLLSLALWRQRFR